MKCGRVHGDERGMQRSCSPIPRYLATFGFVARTNHNICKWCSAVGGQARCAFEEKRQEARACFPHADTAGADRAPRLRLTKRQPARNMAKSDYRVKRMVTTSCTTFGRSRVDIWQNRVQDRKTAVYARGHQRCVATRQMRMFERRQLAARGCVSRLGVCAEEIVFFMCTHHEHIFCTSSERKVTLSGLGTTPMFLYL